MQVANIPQTLAPNVAATMQAPSIPQTPAPNFIGVNLGPPVNQNPAALSQYANIMRVPGQQTIPNPNSLLTITGLPNNPNYVVIPVQPGRPMITQPIVAAPKQQRVMAKKWVQPTPFTAEQIAQLQLTKMKQYPPGTELTLANPVCQSCGRAVRAEAIDNYRQQSTADQPMAVILDELGIDKPCCRLEYLRQPQIARGVWLLPEEKQSGNKIEVTPKDVVIETSQRPIRPVAISAELLKEGEQIATAGTGRVRRVIYLTGSKQTLL